MDSIISSKYLEPIVGTDENDIIVANQLRDEVFGNGGNDSIYASTYLITVNGGDGNDTITAGRSYINLVGDAGDDVLRVDTSRRLETIANVTLTGGAGADTFELVSDSKRVSSIHITDFNIEEGDRLNLIINGVAPEYVAHTTDADGNMVVAFDYNRIKLTLDGISDFDAMSTVRVADGLTVAQLGALPYGLEQSGNELKVHSEYEGALWLGGSDLINDKTVWGDDSIEIIDASDDTIGGRILAGNDDSNSIRANDYGSLLWGGDDGDDTLIGGDGADMFFTGKESGDDVISDCGEGDLVILMDIDLSDLEDINLTVDDGSIDIDSGDSHVRIEKTEGARTTTVQLADNSKWQYTYSDRSWQFKS